MYCSPNEVWGYLGKDAYTKVRSEIVGTSSTTASTNYELSNDNIISNSCYLYDDGIIIPTSSYSLNLDDGKIIGLTGSVSGSIISADYDYAKVADSVLQNMISSSDLTIEKETGRKFYPRYTSSEYFSVDKKQKTFFLNNYPAITISAVEVNSVPNGFTPEWVAAEEGIDYISNSDDLELGRIRFLNSSQYPLEGEDQLKVTYVYGSDTVPSDVKELSILLTIKQLMSSSVYKSIFVGQDNFTPVRLDNIDNRIEELKQILKKYSISSI